MSLGVHASIRVSGRKERGREGKRAREREEVVGVHYGMNKDQINKQCQIVSVMTMEQKRYGKHKAEKDNYCHTC